jgi:hypothetical protein
VEHADGKSIIHIDHEPGFIVKEGLVKMTFFPGWGIAGKARLRIPSVSSFPLGNP